MSWESAKHTGAARYTVAAITYIVAFGPQAPSTPRTQGALAVGQALDGHVGPWQGAELALSLPSGTHSLGAGRR